MCHLPCPSHFPWFDYPSSCLVHNSQHPILEQPCKLTGNCSVLQASPSCTSARLGSHPASSLSWPHFLQMCGCVCSLYTWVYLSCFGLWAGVYHVASWSHVSLANTALSVIKAHKMVKKRWDLKLRIDVVRHWNTKETFKWPEQNTDE